MTEKTLLTAKEVSEKLGVHVNTVRAMAEDGRLKGIKTKGENGHWRFHLNDIESFMGSGKLATIDSILGDAKYILDTIPSSLLKGHPSDVNLWEFVNNYYGIRSVFGSYAVHAEKDKYAEIIDRKGFIWLGEGSLNLMDVLNQNKNHRDKFVLSEIEYGFGVVKYPSIFGESSYSLLPLLIVKDYQNQKWVVNGVLQQFFPDLRKGLVVLPLEQAKNLYIGLEIYNKKTFVELYNDPYISDKFINKAKELEKDSSDL